MSYEEAIYSSIPSFSPSIPGLSQFRGVFTERGRKVEYELQGYLELTTFQDAWKWRARMVDMATGIEASAGGFLGRKTAMREAKKNLFEKLEHSGVSYTVTVMC